MTSTPLAAATTPRGEVVLRRREPGGHLELRVNGVLVMDSAETSSEQRLAACTLSRLAATEAGSTPRVLVGGLGLGFTLAGLLESPLPGEVVVAEIEEAVVAWHRAGLISGTAAVLRDTRLDLRICDVREVIDEAEPGMFDAILLDVDNGPAQLVQDGNAALYETAFLRSCRRALSASGFLAVWSADPAPDLERRLRDEFGTVEVDVTPVRLGERTDSCLIYLAARGVPREEASCPAR